MVVDSLPLILHFISALCSSWFIDSLFYFQGYIPGLYNVGTHYFAGKGVEMDMKKAAECFQKAADQGFVLAQVSWLDGFFERKSILSNKPYGLSINSNCRR